MRRTISRIGPVVVGVLALVAIPARRWWFRQSFGELKDFYRLRPLRGFTAKVACVALVFILPAIVEDFLRCIWYMGYWVSAHAHG